MDSALGRPLTGLRNGTPSEQRGRVAAVSSACCLADHALCDRGRDDSHNIGVRFS